MQLYQKLKEIPTTEYKEYTCKLNTHYTYNNILQEVKIGEISERPMCWTVIHFSVFIKKSFSPRWLAKEPHKVMEIHKFLDGIDFRLFQPLHNDMSMKRNNPTHLTGFPTCFGKDFNSYRRILQMPDQRPARVAGDFSGCIHGLGRRLGLFVPSGIGCTTTHEGQRHRPATGEDKKSNNRCGAEDTILMVPLNLETCMMDIIRELQTL